MSDKRQRKLLKRKRKLQRRKRAGSVGAGDPSYALPAGNFGVPDWTLFDDPESRTIWPEGVALPTAAYPSNEVFQRDFAVFNDQVRGRSLFLSIGDGVDLAPWAHALKKFVNAFGRRASTRQPESGYNELSHNR